MKSKEPAKAHIRKDMKEEKKILNAASRMRKDDQEALKAKKRK